MSEAFAFSREYDFIRLEGLRKATGKQIHEWDIYIVKELIDNALDADELLWGRDTRQFPSIYIRMEYTDVPPPQKRQLVVWVWNRMPFPVQKIESVFATRWYTSQKAFIKGLSRGSLGNALKTLLGIPYALHNRVADDWEPDLKPFSIQCGGIEYLPRFIIEPAIQSIQFKCAARPCKLMGGTLISVGLDYFVQEFPRTLAEIKTLAYQYHLCNPHVEFHWSIEISEQAWQKEYVPLTDWHNKFSWIAPVQWYSPANFKDFLGAFHRERCQQSLEQLLPIEAFCQRFAGFSNLNQQSYLATQAVIQELGHNSLKKLDIDSPLVKTLYEILIKHSLPFKSLQLGYIGQEHICKALDKNSLPIAGQVQYTLATDTDQDPHMPFVIEVAAVYLQGGKRQLWTAINFSPSYDDPFLSSRLYSPAQPDNAVLGLRGLLDSYGFHKDMPILFFVHLICPNIEHTEFSKTDINHLPFKKVLGETVDIVQKKLKNAQEEEERRLKKLVFETLASILSELHQHERFVPEQLLEALRLKLSQEQELTTLLDRPDILGKLRTYISSYEKDHPDINQFVARPVEILLYIPSHPNHYFSIPIEYIARDLPEHHNINKILYVYARELEPVVLENNWLCRMDMALLHAPSVISTLEDALLKCIERSNLPILLLHHGDEESYMHVAQIQAQLKQKLIPINRLVDLTERMKANEAPTKRMPGELEAWLLQRMETQNIPIKYIPLRINTDIHDRFEQYLREYILKGVEKQFALNSLLSVLDSRMAYKKMITSQLSLEKQLKQYLYQKESTESYVTALEHITENFFVLFKQKYDTQIQEIVQEWIMRGARS